MPVVQNLYNNRISMKLNAGNNPATGKMIVKSAGLNKLSEAADAEKIMVIAELAAPYTGDAIISKSFLPNSYFFLRFSGTVKSMLPQVMREPFVKRFISCEKNFAIFFVPPVGLK